MNSFDPNNEEHRAIVLAAMAAADALGQGRLTAAREQLLLNDIRPTTQALNEFVFKQGANLDQVQS